MRLRRHFKFEESTGIDLAPMLDFVLNLLIFFIITAVFAKELSLAMNRPGAQAARRAHTERSGCGNGMACLRLVGLGRGA